MYAGVVELVDSTDLGSVASVVCGFESRRPHQKKRDILLDVSFLLVRHFCFAKVVACGRVTERERGNPLRFPPHTPPSLR